MTIKNKQKLMPLVASSSDTKQAGTDIVLQKYLQEIRSYRILSKAEAQKLALRAKKNQDKDAANELIISNLRLVVKIALDYQKYWNSNFLDLIQEGNMGLVQALKKFNPNRGIKFSYYASYWIKAYILRFIQDNWRMVKICTTQTMRRLFFNLNKEKRKLESRGETPDSRTLAKNLKVNEQQIIDASYRINKDDISLESPANDGSGNTYSTYIPCYERSAEELAVQNDLKESIRNLLETRKDNLDLREKIILKDRLMSDSPRTLESLAGQMQISRERVRQIQENLLKKLRSYFMQQMPDFALGD